MNKKLTFPELAELLSAATNTSKRLSELALRETFAVITQSLVDGESVKIQDLGVFKVSSVSPRKSVDVNTGKAIEIPGHNKVTFTTDKRLAEAVNASFASFEAVVLEDDVTAEMLGKIDAEPMPVSATEEDVPMKVEPEVVEDAVVPESSIEAEPVVQEPAEDVKTDVAEEISSEEETLIEEAPSEVAEQQAPEAIQEVEQEIAPEEPVVETKDVEESEPETASVEEQKNEPEEEESPQQPQVAKESKESQGEPDREVEPKPKYHYHEYDDEDDDYDYDWWSTHKTLKGFVFGTVFGFALCAAMMFGYIYLSSNGEVGAADGIGAGEVVAADTIVGEIDSAMNAKLKSAQIAAEPEEEVEALEVVEEQPKEVLDTITSKNFLTRMARRHYGNGHFWVYIYEENRSKIENPNNVRPGTVLVIPDAKKYGINKDDEESVKKAIKKEGEIQSKFM